MTQLPAAGYPGRYVAEWLPVLDIPEPAKQSRLTVFFRWLLLIPQYVALFFMGIAAFCATVVGWFAALFTGRLPNGVFTFLAGYLGYATRVESYQMLLVDKYPPFGFSAPDHPVQIEVHPGELNRVAVFFRIVLAIPAMVVQGVIMTGWAALSFLAWIVVLVLGWMPRPLFEAIAAIERYSMRFRAYMLMLTPAYPTRLFGDGPESAGAAGVVTGARSSATRPLRVSGAGIAILVVFILAGLFSGSAWSDFGK